MSAERDKLLKVVATVKKVQDAAKKAGDDLKQEQVKRETGQKG